MIAIRILDWHSGLPKVKLTKAFQKYLGLSLSEAKTITDRILAKEIVIVETKNNAFDELFASNLVQFGLVIERVEID